MDTLAGDRISLEQNDGSLETAEPFGVGDDLRSFQKEFVTHTSYEMRSMLNAITGFGDLLRDKAIMPEHRDYGDEIYNASRKLVRLVDEMVEYEYLCQGSVTVNCCQLPASDIIEDIKRSLGAKVETIQKRLMLVLAGDIPDTLTLDGNILNRSLMHLADAFFSRFKGNLAELRIYVRRNCLQPAIVFDLCSSAMENDDFAYERSKPMISGYPQVSMHEILRDAKLAISRALAKLVYGDIEIRRPRDGEHIFSLVVPITSMKLPLESVDKNIETTMIQSAGERSLDVQEDIMCTGRILVVDDEEQCRTVISLLLESMGLEVDTASDGDEAITKVTDEYFDLIFMDVWMPWMNGCDAAEKMRNEGLTTPMFAITADAGEDTSEKCMASGFNGVIAKPADKKKLYGIVSRHLPVSAIEIE